ncbi:S-methyl-5'-thioadenosine phosphorylase [Methanopyrus sp.]
MTEVGVIGGTGFRPGLPERRRTVFTPYGTVRVDITRVGDHRVYFINRHGKGHDLPPHRINYRAIVWAMRELGVKRVLATNSVGVINPDEYEPGDIVLPVDFLDFTKHRPTTFYDEKVVHVDVTEPYCPELREALMKAANDLGYPVKEGAVYVATEGPRFETPAEIRAFRKLGGDIVGMTGFPEVVLARELEICYASVCLCTNYAAGIDDRRRTIEEVFEIVEELRPKAVELIERCIEYIPSKRSCPCSRALEGAEV